MYVWMNWFCDAFAATSVRSGSIFSAASGRPSMRSARMALSSARNASETLMSEVPGCERGSRIVLISLAYEEVIRPRKGSPNAGVAGASTIASIRRWFCGDT
jgi:hypothetical protein